MTYDQTNRKRYIFSETEGGDGYARGYTGRDRSAGYASGEQGSVCGDGCEYDRCE